MRGERLEMPRPPALAECPRNFGSRTEEMGVARNVGKGPINAKSARASTFRVPLSRS